MFAGALEPWSAGIAAPSGTATSATRLFDGFSRTRFAYDQTWWMPNPTNMKKQISRYQSPEAGSSPAMSCAISVVNG